MIVGGKSNPYNVNLPWMGNVPTASADPTTYLDSHASTNNASPSGNSSTDLADTKRTDKVEHNGGGGKFGWKVGGKDGGEWRKWLDSMGISFQNPNTVKYISELTYWLTGAVPGGSLTDAVRTALGRAVNLGMAVSIFTQKGGKSVIALTKAVYNAIKALLPSHKVPESNQIDKEGVFLGYDSDGHEMWPWFHLFSPC